jgi:hypothetical protein
VYLISSLITIVLKYLVGRYRYFDVFDRFHTKDKKSRKLGAFLINMVYNINPFEKN